ncbi:MAG: hypothetical protein AAGC46_13800, partial [Solirubrobacteraceae bacterium]
VYTSIDGADLTNPQAPFRLMVRDIVSNTTLQVTSSGRALATGIDKTGRYVSFEKWDQTVLDPGTTRSSLDPYTVYVLDLQKRTAVPVSRATGASGARATGAQGMIDGDGTAVVFTASDVPGLGSGLFRRDLTTNVTTRLAADPNLDWRDAAAEITSLSDDGTKVGIAEQDGTGAIVTAAGTTATPGAAWVSADGTTAAYVDQNEALGSVWKRTLATGAVTSAGSHVIPDFAQVAWISPDGGQVLVAPTNGLLFGSHPATFQPGPGAAWIDAGRFANLFRRSATAGTDEYQISVLSRTGVYAEVLTPGSTMSLVNTYSGPLPGGADRPPASVYAYVNSLQCADAGDDQYVQLNPTPGLFEDAVSVTGHASAGSQDFGTATVTDPTDFHLPIATGARSVHVDLSVRFADGTTTTGSYDYPIRLVAGC